MSPLMGSAASFVDTASDILRTHGIEDSPLEPPNMLELSRRHLRTEPRPSPILISPSGREIGAWLEVAEEEEREDAGDVYEDGEDRYVRPPPRMRVVHYDGWDRGRTNEGVAILFSRFVLRNRTGELASPSNVNVLYLATGFMMPPLYFAAMLSRAGHDVEALATTFAIPAQWVALRLDAYRAARRMLKTGGDGDGIAPSAVIRIDCSSRVSSL